MAAGSEDRVPVAVGVAASAGGVEALTGFVNRLPAHFPGTVLVVLHVPETGPSVLPGILARACQLPVAHAVEGDVLSPGVVLVAPPGQHLLVRDGKAELNRGPRENGHRPSADALFRSLAESFGPRSAGIVLSGTMDDGAAGLRAIRLSGGMSIVQDPAEAAFPGMPTAAIAEAEPEAVCRVGEMVSRLTEWIKDLPDDLPRAEAVGESTRGSKEMSELSEFTCPECGGTLWEDRSYGTERYRCRVGHSFSADNLLIGKQDAIEAALWAAIVALQERADISKRVMKRLEGVARPARLVRLQREIEETSGRVNVLHGLIDELVQQAAFDDEIVTVGNERDDADATG